MSDSAAQPNTHLVTRSVGNPHSAMGSILRKGLVGGNFSTPSSTVSAVSPTPSVPAPLSSSASVDTIPSPSDATPAVVSPPVSDPAPVTSPVPTTAPPLTSASPLPPSVSSPTQDEDLAVLENIIAQVEGTNSGSPSPSTQTPTPLTDVPPSSSSSPMDATGLLSQVAPQVVQETVQQAQALGGDPLNPAGVVSSTHKEAAESVSIDQIAVDAARGAQQVEVEPTPEIPPEVESYLQKVEENTALAPPEIVIADGSVTSPKDHSYPSQPVVVLPITPEEEAQGARKSSRFSIRWLVEWSRKLMKIFSGKVIYRMPEGNAS